MCGVATSAWSRMAISLGPSHSGNSPSGVGTRCSAPAFVPTTHRHKSYQTSFAWIDLRRLLADLCRIDDELERISILILFHQLQVNEPFSTRQRFALGKSFARGLEQR